ncbi:MAG: cation diffusion facilitator family transporter [Candidatus Aminicenantales bacterium]|jgi:cobalt-zinc-cadmium efflux system protein
MNHPQSGSGSSPKRILAAFFLNAGFTLVEIAGGLLTNSTAILADAVHDLGDSFALAQAWYFERLAGRRGEGAYTYGYRRFSLLGGLITTIFMLASSLFVLARAVPRLTRPDHADARGMAALAVVGIAANALAMRRLGKETGFSARTVALHLLEDVLGWVAVLVVAVVLLFRHVPILDPLLAILITLYVLGRAFRNLGSVVPIFLEAAPKGTDLDAISAAIGKIDHVRNVHHVHVWSLDGEHNVLSAHLVVDRDLAPEEYRRLKDDVRRVVGGLGLFHSTVEIELPEEACRIPGDIACQ